MSAASFPATYVATAAHTSRPLYFTDGATITGVKQTPIGIRVEGRIARTGLQSYLNNDGSMRREYRPPEEVFSEDSLLTLAGAPVTRLHPHRNRVTADNWASLAKGTVGTTWRRVGDFVEADLLITDRGVIDEINSGELAEISAGYTADVAMTPGIAPDGQQYDGVQHDIRFNHVALGPRGWARAGHMAALQV